MSFPFDDEADLLDLQELSDSQLMIAITQAREDERMPSDTEIKQMLAVLTVAYPPPKITIEMARQRVELYCRMLADIPAQELAKKIEATIKRCTFFPTIAEIRESNTSSGLAAVIERSQKQRQVEAIHAEALRRGWSMNEANDPTAKLSNRRDRLK